MTAALRLGVTAVVVLLLARAVRAAWPQRHLAVAVWRRIRLRHVLGSLVLLIGVLGVALALMTLVPVTGFGLGSLIGLYGNAVFAPLEEAYLRAGADGGGMTWGVAVFGYGFLGLLLLLFPWLAYVEEHVFRSGLEHARPGRQVVVALRFGLAHLVMLIPVAAALAIGVAGFAYGLVYRRAYRRAVQRQQIQIPGGVAVITGPDPVHARAEALLASTVWHTTFNSLVAVLVLAVLTVDLVRA